MWRICCSWLRQNKVANHVKSCELLTSFIILVFVIYFSMVPMWIWIYEEQSREKKYVCNMRWLKLFLVLHPIFCWLWSDSFSLFCEKFVPKIYCKIVYLSVLLDMSYSFSLNYIVKLNERKLSEISIFSSKVFVAEGHKTFIQRNMI